MKAPNPYIRQGGVEEKAAVTKRLFNVKSQDLNLVLSCFCVLLAAPMLASLITGESLGSLFLGAFGLLPTPPAPMAERVVSAVRPELQPGDHLTLPLDLEAPSSQGLTGTMEASSSLAPVEIPREILRRTREAQAAAQAAQATMGGMGGAEGLQAMGSMGQGGGVGASYGLGAEGAGGPAGGRGAAGGAAGALGRKPGGLGAEGGAGAPAGAAQEEEKPSKPMLQTLKTSGSEAIQKLREVFNPKAKEPPDKKIDPKAQDRSAGRSGGDSGGSWAKASAAAAAAANEASAAADAFYQSAASINTDFKGPWQKDTTLVYIHSALSQAKQSGLAAASQMQNYASQLQDYSQQMQTYAQMLGATHSNPTADPPPPTFGSMPPPPDISQHLASIAEAQDDIKKLSALLRQQGQAQRRHQKPKTPSLIKKKGGDAAFD